MPYWYYDKEAFQKTPSIQDGINYATEYKYRKEGARFIVELGSVLELGYNTWATGVVFFHRFYMFQSFKDFPHYVTACCCLFLAGKVEETPKKCRDIIKVARTLLSEENFKTFGEDPKEEVMTMEKILLQTFKFDLKIQHPYSFLTKYAKTLRGDKTKLQKMVQMAWTFINDSLCTTLSIQWEPEIIAISLMYLATKLSKFQVISWKNRMPGQARWWEMFVEDLKMNVIEDICHQVLDLYSPNNEEKKSEKEDPLQVSLKSVSCQIPNQQEAAVFPTCTAVHSQNTTISSTQSATDHPQESTVSFTQIAVVHPQKPTVSSVQTAVVSPFEKRIMNADPRTIKTETNCINSEPATTMIKAEPLYAEKESNAVDLGLLHAKNEFPYLESYSNNLELLHTKNETAAAVTEPFNFKVEPPITDTSFVNVEIPFYNPEMTKPSFGTSLSTSPTAVSAANSQPYSPSFLLPDFNMPPPTFDLPTAAAVLANNQINNSYINPWKTDMQIKNEITESNKYQEIVAYPDIYSNNNNNNYIKDRFKDFTRDDFHVMRSKNPNNLFQRRSYWDDEDWENSNRYFRNESSKFDKHFRGERYSDYSNDRVKRRDNSYSRHYSKSRWDDDCTDKLKKKSWKNSYYSIKNHSSRV